MHVCLYHFLSRLALAFFPALPSYDARANAVKVQEAHYCQCMHMIAASVDAFWSE